MKKTNVLLVLILLINAVILWQVMCPSCSGQSKCDAQTECSADDAKCDHADKKECCKANKECKHGDNASCKHVDNKVCSHGGNEFVCYKGDSTCKPIDCVVMMMLHMPEDHKAETMTWMKDELGLTDEQIATMGAAMAELNSKMETVHSDMETAVDAQNESFKGMLSEEQITKVEEMISKHHGSIATCEHHKGHHSHDVPANETE
jgi:hypothetical protein